MSDQTSVQGSPEQQHDTTSLGSDTLSQKERVSYSKPCYDTALGIKSQVIVCTKGPNSNKLALPTEKIN